MNSERKTLRGRDGRTKRERKIGRNRMRVEENKREENEK